MIRTQLNLDLATPMPLGIFVSAPRLSQKPSDPQGKPEGLNFKYDVIIMSSFTGLCV